MSGCRYLLEAHDLFYRYRNSEKAAVNGVSLSLPAGSVTAVLGPNAAGKSTLLRLLLGFYRPDEGEVSVCSAESGSSRQISFVPQREQTPFAFRVADYLLLGRTPYLGLFGLPAEKDVEVVRAVLRRLEIENLADKPINTLSGGEHQLVLIGRALVQESPIMLLDEPTNHLDLHHRYQVLALLRALADEGRAILFTSHEPQAAAAIADRVLLMKNGRIIVDASPDEAITEQNLSALYAIPLKVTAVEGMPVVLPRW